MNKLFSLWLLVVPLFFASALFAQPANDECSNAIMLNDVSNWCSATGAYSNAGATLSPVANPSCFPNGANDVWFSFVAEANYVSVTVVGNTSGNIPPGGTLEQPQLAIYEGSCSGTLNLLQCASDGFGNNVVTTLAGPLIIGQTYFIRVDARNDNEGTFKLCVNNYNAVPDPSGDCPTGVILCDKSPFNVESVEGEGSVANEVDPGICIQAEISSSWYRWTCKDPGTLAFTITPNNPSDDIDFAVFELPGGINDCSNKVKIRCEAAGENVGSPFPDWEPCTGPTGLSLTETDTDEIPGCPAGQNNFVSAIDMVAGKSYALVINNFSQTGNGFSMEFGGSGTFQGPDANFNHVPDPVCVGSQVLFSDASTSVEGITAWQWSFGVGASPATANGEGPHNVTYNSPGVKSIALTITSEAGCVITRIKTITILPTPDVNPTIIADYCGPQDATGSITLDPPAGADLPFTYNWQGSGTFSGNNTLEDLQQGSYSVVVKDANGCTQQFNFEVPEGLSLAAGVDPVKSPTCHGDSDGSISVSIEIANEPVLFDFGGGPQSDNTLSSIPAGTYNVHVVDAAGCEGFFTIVVEDFPPLEISIDPLDISCFGEMDGSITVTATGGAGSYAYLWSNGATTPTIGNLSAGTYSVTVTDENGCAIVAEADIIEPAELLLSLDVTDVICFGDATGVITVNATGGTPPFEYSSDGVTFQPDPVLTGLPAGKYIVIVKDSRGCTFSLDAVVDEPPPLIVDAGPDQTVDLGYTADLDATVTPPLRPVTLSWTPAETLSCDDCLDPTASPFKTTTYLLTAVDETNCVASDSVTITLILNRPIYVPNVFSPNGDGLNDFFTVYGGVAARSIRTLKVFNRWGDMVFEGFDLPLNDEPSGWDGYFKGKLVNPAVFAYFAEVEFIDGVVVLYEGDVTILR